MRAGRYRYLVRLLCLAALAGAAVAGAAGCGGVGVSSGSLGNVSNLLTIYSSMPLQGTSAAVSTQIVNGEKLALAEAGGHVGQFKVSYYSMDDANPKTGLWDPGVTAADAKTAAQDNSAIAYLGDYNSGASAVSLPLINAAGILQVSPAGSPYVGLTSSLDAGQDEPERFYPTGKRTYGRLMAADPIEAGAQIQLMKALKVKRVYVLNDEDPFQVPLSQIVAGDAEKAGIEVVGNDGVDTTDSTEFAGEVHRVVQSGAQAVFFSGGTSAGVVTLWRELYGADPNLLLLGPSTMVNSAFLTQVGAAAQNTYLSTPLLPTSMYPPAAQNLYVDYSRHFHEVATPDALYGYEAMSVVLEAIRRAGAQGNNRQAVIDQFFATKNRNSVLGSYSIQPSGDTTLSLYGVDRVSGGQPVFWRAFDGG